jgi:hypothetical protein
VPGRISWPSSCAANPSHETRGTGDGEGVRADAEVPEDFAVGEGKNEVRVHASAIAPTPKEDPASSHAAERRRKARRRIAANATS